MAVEVEKREVYSGQHGYRYYVKPDGRYGIRHGVNEAWQRNETSTNPYVWIDNKVFEGLIDKPRWQ